MGAITKTAIKRAPAAAPFGCGGGQKLYIRDFSARSLRSLGLRLPQGAPPQSSVATLICRFRTKCRASAGQRFARAREMAGCSFIIRQFNRAAIPRKSALVGAYVRGNYTLLKNSAMGESIYRAPSTPRAVAPLFITTRFLPPKKSISPAAG